jgi:two-component system, LytTR family, response regulator
MPGSRKLINAIIVDDEKKACTNLEHIIGEYIGTNIRVAGIAQSTADCEKLIAKIKPELVFLDIEMPNENAFDFLARIGPFNFEVIFVTAYDEYAVKAFRLNAIDYILKPISINELKLAVDKLYDKLNYKALLVDNISYPELLTEFKGKSLPEKVKLKDGVRTEVVHFEDLYYVEAQGSYCRIVFAKAGDITDITMSSPLSYYEEILPSDRFFRAHRSYLINCSHINKLHPDNVVIENGLSIPVSRRRHAELVEYLKEHRF